MGMSKIFRNRWAALFWAGGVVWTAYDVAEANAPPSHKAVAKPDAQPTDATGAAVSADDMNLLTSVVG